MSVWRMAEDHQRWWQAWRERHPFAALEEAVQAAWNAGVQQAMHEEGYATPSAYDALGAADEVRRIVQGDPGEH